MTRTSITAVDARRAASDWIDTVGQTLPGFGGAWLAGSLAWLADDAAVPPWSDVDVMVVMAGASPPKLGKLLHQNALLEISFIGDDEIASAESLAANYRVSCSFVQGKMLADPTGRLRGLQNALRPTFLEPAAIRDRMTQARDAALAGLGSGPPDQRPLSWRAMWVFPAGLPTHLPLLAVGENPTVRRRYEKARAVFELGHRLDLYEVLLAATGYGDVTQAETLRYWEATARAFDLAALHTETATPFFASDISPVARSISIDGPLAAIEGGAHREALFWLVATQARSLAILEEVAPDAISRQSEADFLDLLNRIGIASDADRTARSTEILALLPEIEAFSLEMIDR